MIYNTCQYCGAALDAGEYCDCVNARFDRLTPDNKGKIVALIEQLAAEQKKPFRCCNTETAKNETTRK